MSRATAAVLPRASRHAPPPLSPPPPSPRRCVAFESCAVWAAPAPALTVHHRAHWLLFRSGGSGGGTRPTQQLGGSQWVFWTVGVLRFVLCLEGGGWCGYRTTCSMHAGVTSTPAACTLVDVPQLRSAVAAPGLLRERLELSETFSERCGKQT